MVNRAGPPGRTVSRLAWTLFVAMLAVAARSLSAQEEVSNPTLAVLDLNDGGSIGPDVEDLSNLGAGIASMLTTEMMRNPRATMVERDQIRTLIAEQGLQLSGLMEADAIEVGKLLGAQYMLFGTFTDVMSQLRVDVRVVHVASGRLIRAREVTRPRSEVFATVAQLGALVFEDLDLQPTEALPERATGPVAAVILFSQAIRFEDSGDRDSARRLYRAALEIFPEYEEAESRLGNLGAGRLVNFSADRPRVMVILEEEGESATTALVSLLIETGFRVIDPAFTRSASDQALTPRALAGDDGAATQLGRDLGAQVLILGSVLSEDRANPADARLRVATAHLRMRALRLDRTRVISTARADARAPDATGLGARQSAIGQAVEDALGESSFLGDLLIDWAETPWEDDAYWEPSAGSVASQIQRASAEAPRGEPSLRIAILESEAYPLREAEGTRSIDIVGPRRVRIRGLVSDTEATVHVDSQVAEHRVLDVDEALGVGLVAPGLEFEAEVRLDPDDETVRVTATRGGEEIQVDVSPDIGTRWAVVIGISEYSDRRITPLQYADDDARAMYDFLRSPVGGEVPESNIRLLIDEEATSAAIREALFVFLQQAAPEDFVTVYVASHGSPDPGRSENLYLLSYDTDIDALASSAFPMWDVKAALRRQIAAERVVVIADACRSAGTLVDEANPIAGAFSELFSPSRRLTLSAAALHEVSFEDAKWGGGHGVFTHFLLEGLGGAADANGDGVVTFREAVAFVQHEVPASTEGEQTPQWSGLGDVPLSVLDAGRDP